MAVRQRTSASRALAIRISRWSPGLRSRTGCSSDASARATLASISASRQSFLRLDFQIISVLRALAVSTRSPSFFASAPTHRQCVPVSMASVAPG